MPISKDEWEKGYALGEWEKRIIDFLKTNRNNAFTSSEIMEGIKYLIDYRDFWGSILGTLGFLGMLEDLVKKGEIKKKTVNYMHYYIIR